MKIRTMKELFEEMIAVANGEIPAPPDAGEPSFESMEVFLEHQATDRTKTDSH